MDKSKKVKQRFFTARELRISIVMIILLSFLSSVVFMYLIKVFGGTIKEHSILAFILVMVGYAAVVGFLTTIFTHRFVGPFERLRYELSIIISGDYQRRLNVRKHDDAYVKAFVEDVNKVILLLQENDRCGAEAQRDLFSALSAIIGKMDDGDPHRKELVSLRNKVSTRLR
jgi:hypothetical protein